jgi:hypothetical protein
VGRCHAGAPRPRASVRPHRVERQLGQRLLAVTFHLVAVVFVP